MRRGAAYLFRETVECVDTGRCSLASVKPAAAVVLAVGAREPLVWNLDLRKPNPFLSGRF